MILPLKRATALALTCVLCLFPLRGWAQNDSVQGVVSDAANGEPVPGVVVMVQGTNNGVSTDLDGHYVLPLKGQKNPVIVFRSIGYSTQEIAVNGRTNIDVSLSPDMDIGNFTCLQQRIPCHLRIRPDHDDSG